MSAAAGEFHSLAVDEVEKLAKEHQQLTHGDAQTLLVFISGSKPDRLSDADWEERVNVILNALRMQEAEVPGLTDYLLATAEHSPSRILRLYAMQHLALWHHREKSAEKRQQILALFQRLAETDGGETAGSAVQFLNGLQREADSNDRSIVSQDVITRAAIKLASDSASSQDVRISALQSCTERRMAEILPTARQIAADTVAVIPLRKAVVFAIGRMGGKEDEDFLERLQMTTPALHAATQPALDHLRSATPGNGLSSDRSGGKY